MAGRAFRFTLARQIMHCWRNIQFTFSLELHIEHMNKKLARRGCVFTLDPRRDPRRDSLREVE